MSQTAYVIFSVLALCSRLNMPSCKAHELNRTDVLLLVSFVMIFCPCVSLFDIFFFPSPKPPPACCGPAMRLRHTLTHDGPALPELVPLLARLATAQAPLAASTDVVFGVWWYSADSLPIEKHQCRSWAKNERKMSVK
jgi:hypothetical protein